MPFGGQNSERVLMLAPVGRDAEVGTRLLQEAGWVTLTCSNVAGLCEELTKGSAFAVVAEEALANGNLLQLVSWIKNQPAWSDFPILILTRHGDAPDRNAFARRLQDDDGDDAPQDAEHREEAAQFVRAQVRHYLTEDFKHLSSGARPYRRR